MKTTKWLLALALAAVHLSAQSDQGTVVGTVTDQTHQVIRGALVTLTDPQRQFQLETRTGENGTFAFPPVKASVYTLTAGAPGFSTVSESGIQVNVSQRIGVDLQLAVGSVKQTVEVTAASPMQNEDSSVGQVVSGRTLAETPLANRNYVYMAQLAAGVAGPNAGARGTSRGDFSANGQRTEQNDFLLDGIDNNSNLVDFLNQASYVTKPPPDALEEFRIQTANYTAELGHSAGAVVSATIKSGTNEFKGSVWEYFRNDKLNARDFFAAQRPENRGNQFGATLGGPILKNKLFFFADGELNRQIFGTTGTYTVPTAAMRTGDFSQLPVKQRAGSMRRAARAPFR